MRFEALSARHDRAGFSCGSKALDEFLHNFATQNQKRRLSTTHVLVDTKNPREILAYYSLAAGQIERESLVYFDRKALPRYPVPAVRLARLAVSADRQKQGLASLCIGDCVNRCLSLSKDLGIRVLLVNAKDEKTAEFYRRFGFTDTVTDALTLYLNLNG